VPDRTDGVAGNPFGATLAAVLLFVLGIAIGAGALNADRKDRELRRGLLHAEGTVVSQIRQHRPEGTAIVPLIAFVTASGERISFTARESDPSVYWLGAKIPVLYQPENPSAARIDKGSPRLLRNVLAGGASLLLICLGAYVAWYARRWEQQRAGRESAAQ